MISFATDQPLQEAVDKLGKRTPIGTMLSSRQWEGLPVQIRDASFFSSRVMSERILVEAQKRILQRIKLERDKAEAGGRVMERGRFITEMKDVLHSLGYEPDPDKKGSVQDLSYARRLGLIWQMQIDQAQGYAKWKTSQDPDILEAVPAMELVRGKQRRERRDWPRIWAAHGGKFYGEPGPDYPNAPGRMIALVNDPIWKAISRFGTPWPPFDWGSGMVLRNVRRREALKLVTRDGEHLLTEEMPPQESLQTSFTDGLKGSAKGMGEDARMRLRSEFGDTIRFDRDAIYFQRDYTSANEHREETIPEELRARARSEFERGEEAFAELRREGDGAEAFFGDETADEVRRLYLAQLSAVSNGRKPLFHDTYTEEQGRALLQVIERAMPGVRAEFSDGHLVAWRPDLLPMSGADLIDLSGGDLPVNGVLLGYGRPDMAMMGEDHAVVLLVDKNGNTVSGFHAPLRNAAAFAQARLRDLTDAMGEGFEFRIIPRRKGGGR